MLLVVMTYYSMQSKSIVMYSYVLNLMQLDWALNKNVKKNLKF